MEYFKNCSNVCVENHKKAIFYYEYVPEGTYDMRLSDIHEICGKEKLENQVEKNDHKNSEEESDL